jgi:hypothetical protein
VRKEYLGKGRRAEQAARQIAEAQAQREAEKLAIQREQLRTAKAKQLTVELEDLSTSLLEATLLAAGYWRGRDYRRWRRRRGIK